MAMVEEDEADSFDSQDVGNRLQALSSAPKTVDISADGELILTAKGHGAEVWRVETGTPEEPLEHLEVVSAAVFSPDATKIATGSGDEVVRIWLSPVDPALIDQDTPTDQVSDRDAEKLVICAARFEQVQGKEKSKAALQESIRDPGRRAIRDLAWSSDGAQLAAACWDRVVRVWAAGSGALIATLHGHANAVNCLLFAPGDAEIIAGGEDCTVRVWDAPPRLAKDASELQAASSPRPAAAPAATDGLGHTQAMVLPTKLALAASGGQISSVCCTGSLVAAAGADGVISLWSCGSYQPHGQ